MTFWWYALLAIALTPTTDPDLAAIADLKADVAGVRSAFMMSWLSILDLWKVTRCRECKKQDYQMTMAEISRKWWQMGKHGKQC